MRIPLYNPDNGVTRNFMPHLWMFLLQALTPPGHGSPRRSMAMPNGWTRPKLRNSSATSQNIGLVGIGAMTRMVARAYRMADAIRVTRVPVVMGGPHVTEEADEALAGDGGPRHADAVALGEADETWPQIVDEDAVRGELKEIYAPVDAMGKERKPSLNHYPTIPWDKLDLDQFNLIPKLMHPLLKGFREGWGTFPHRAGGIGTRLSVRLRVLHGHRFLRATRFASARMKASSTNCSSTSPRPQRGRPDRGLLHRRRLCHQHKAHQVPAA